MFDPGIISESATSCISIIEMRSDARDFVKLPFPRSSRLCNSFKIFQTRTIRASTKMVYPPNKLFGLLTRASVCEDAVDGSVCAKRHVDFSPVISLNSFQAVIRGLISKINIISINVRNFSD